MTADTPKRNARACEACRVSKSRCIYKTETAICQRCEQNGTQCMVRSKARPMRAVSSRASAAAVVKRDSAIFNDSEFSLGLPTILHQDSSQDAADLHEHHKAIFGEEGSPTPSYESPSKTVLERRQLNLQEAEELLTSFRRKAAFFPFVQIPDDATVPSLARTSPFLLLALLTSASMKDPTLYPQISYEFRRVLSTKVIVDGRRSLDYLQGLLIYIAWCPFHVNPRNNQAFMYMNLAISLVTDLGLDQEHPNLESFNAVNSQGLIQGEYFTSAAKRAYLGCYYLSASLSRGFQKPNNMHYRKLMDTHGENLMLDEPSVEIFSLVKLQRLAERIGEAYSSLNGIHDAQMYARNVALNVQLFRDELQQWRNMTPDQVKNTLSVALMDRFSEITIYSYHLGFLSRPYRDYLRTSSTRIVEPSHLSGCLIASKRFFEYLLSIPEQTYLCFTIVEWALMVQAILVLSRLTFLMATNMAWDAETTRANIPMPMYLDSLCYRFQHLSSTKQQADEKPSNPDVLFVFKLILESVKKSWERRVTNILPNDSIFASRGNCPVFDPSLSAYFGTPESMNEDSLDLSGSTSTGSTFVTPLYHDLWATMTVSVSNTSWFRLFQIELSKTLWNWFENSHPWCLGIYPTG